MKKKFTEIEHTADAAIQVWGKTLSDLFSHAAEGMYHIMLSNIKAKCSKDMPLSCTANSAEDLLVAFLNEINYQAIIKKLVYCFPVQIHIQRQDNCYQLRCRGQASKIAANDFERMLEIKAVTYHNLNIIEEGEMLSARIVFDL